jgi:excisionase family DNA binding protein
VSVVSLPRLSPRLLTTREAAELLRVSQRTILNWIEAETIPYLELPTPGKRREYRIPLVALLQSLRGNFDIAGELRATDEETTAASVSDEDVLAMLDADD